MPSAPSLARQGPGPSARARSGVPYVVHPSFAESSRHRPTLGERWAGPTVAADRDDAPGTGQVWLLDIVRALPWQDTTPAVRTGRP